MTPNYLGFLSTMPQESPLERAIKGGLQTYTDVQKARMQGALAAALPKQLESQQKLAEQQLTKGQQEITKGELEAKYLPGQLESEAQARNLDLQQKQALTKVYPQLLSAQLTKEQQDIATSALQYKINSMSLDQAKDSLIDNKLAILANAKQSGISDDVLAPEYQNLLKVGGKLRADLSLYPKTWGDQAYQLGVLKYAQTPGGVEAKKEGFELSKIKLDTEGKIAIEQAKGSPQYQAAEKAIGEQFGKYTSDLADAHEKANDIVSASDDLMDIVQKHPWQTGALVGGITKYTTVAGQKASFDANTILGDKIASMPAGMFRAPKVGVGVAQSMKINIGADKDETIMQKASLIKAGAIERQEEDNFVNFLYNKYGVTNKQAASTAWNNFMASKPYLDARGNIDRNSVNGIRNWAAWYGQHPEALPFQVHAQHLQEMQGAPQQPTQAVLPSASQAASTYTAPVTGINNMVGNLLMGY
jgi:hypothetical protein